MAGDAHPSACAGAPEAAVVAVPESWASEPAVLALNGAGVHTVLYGQDFRQERATLAQAHGIACDGALPTELLAALPSTRVISFDGTGVWDFVDVDEAARRGITICNIRDYGSVAVAEHTMALILALAKRVTAWDGCVRCGQWNHGEPHTAVQLRGRTLGLVGLGSVGSEVARLATAFGFELIYWSRHANRARERGLSVTRTTLDVLLRRADVISLHLLLTAESACTIGRRELALMKAGALLVNTARGGLIDQEALAEALTVGTLGGVALDVWDPEPPPSPHPLAHLDRSKVILTPHVAASTAEARSAAIQGCVRNILAYLAGKPTNVVHPHASARAEPR
jgi:glycerate dehydrogenase